MSMMVDRGYFSTFSAGNVLNCSAAWTDVPQAVHTYTVGTSNWVGFSIGGANVRWPRGHYSIVITLRAMRTRPQVNSTVNLVQTTGAVLGTGGKIVFPLSISFPTTSIHLSDVLGQWGDAATMDKGQYLLDAVMELVNPSYSDEAVANVGIVSSIQGAPYFIYKAVTVPPQDDGDGGHVSVTVPSVCDSSDNTGYWYPMVEIVSGALTTAASNLLARIAAPTEAYRGDETEDGDWTIAFNSDWPVPWTSVVTSGDLAYGGRRYSQFVINYWSDGQPHINKLESIGGADVTLNIQAMFVVYQP